MIPILAQVDIAMPNRHGFHSRLLLLPSALYRNYVSVYNTYIMTEYQTSALYTVYKGKLVLMMLN
jgi:hypothetical protein